MGVVCLLVAMVGHLLREPHGAEDALLVGHQVARGAVLDHAPSGQHDDAISVSERRQAMSNLERRDGTLATGATVEIVQCRLHKGRAKTTTKQSHD